MGATALHAAVVTVGLRHRLGVAVLPPMALACLGEAFGKPGKCDKSKTSASRHARICNIGGLVQFVHDGLRDGIGGAALAWGLAVYFERKEWLEGKMRMDLVVPGAAPSGDAMRIDVTRGDGTSDDPQVAPPTLASKAQQKFDKYFGMYPAGQQVWGFAVSPFGESSDSCHVVVRSIAALGETVTGRPAAELARELWFAAGLELLRRVAYTYEVAAAAGPRATAGAWVPMTRLTDKGVVGEYKRGRRAAKMAARARTQAAS
ncbi:MAG: hypothetical protein GY772_16725 [bacterium]|nr:hypothetical protein [bacterium]